ncbi:MAG TPA: ASCH domain-containing protein [Thermoplasmata archaeon]|nr:ASCH domain-containing protein [Thermoplasmata archaeon]
MTRSRVDRYWAQFVDALPEAARRPRRYDWVFHFGSKASAREIADLVLRGVKTATGSLKWEYDAKGKGIPKPGDLSVVTDGRGSPECIIENTEIQIVPFERLDGRFAWDSGEGDRSLEGLRTMYWDYVVAECTRLRRRATRKTPLVCEWFRVVYKEPLRDGANDGTHGRGTRRPTNPRAGGRSPPRLRSRAPRSR